MLFLDHGYKVGILLHQPTNIFVPIRRMTNVQALALTGAGAVCLVVFTTRTEFEQQSDTHEEHKPEYGRQIQQQVGAGFVVPYCRVISREFTYTRGVCCTVGINIHSDTIRN